MKPLRIYHDPRQDCSGSPAYARFAEDPAAVVEAFRSSRVPVELVALWGPLEAGQIAVAHDRAHVDRVLSCEENNGFGNADPAVAAAATWELGSFHAAALGALEDGGVAMSPSRGFHHADCHECWNFCTFNGLAVSAILLRQAGLARRVGIVDFDCHWGNGTDAIIQELGLDWIVHLSFGKFKRIVRRGIGFDAWLEALPGQLEELFSGCDLVFYQAGADAHLGDHFGGELSTAQMRLRDRAVFRFAAGRGMPLAWNLAGGYQESREGLMALRLATLEECAAAWGIAAEGAAPRREA